MKTKNTLILLALAISISACNGGKNALLTTSTDQDFWQPAKTIPAGTSDPNAVKFTFERSYEQVIDGFGAVFNELGWDALQMVSPGEREVIMHDFYSPDAFNFYICRMPIGANDYARNWYSLNETPGDFDMEHFNIDRDLTTLIPYIKEAQKIRPDLKVWGSPWCPPAWMKVNNHYACRPAEVNDLPPEGAGRENQTQFIMESEYLEAYAVYFSKYVETYADQGIDIYAVHVQNEPNSCQNFPSCIWTARDLNIFIGEYLGPAFEARGLDTEIWLGTIERPSVEKVDTVLQDPLSSKYVKGVGFQWAGKECIPGVNMKYPDMKLMQTESECGDGSNDWEAAEYTWSLMKHYLENGANSYIYWNSILDETGKSMWGWKQNSLISVDSQTGNVTRNPEFYLMKHLSHFVRPGARKLVSPEGFSMGMLFENPDGSIVGLLANTENTPLKITMEIDGTSYMLELEPHSIHSLEI